MDFRNVEIHTVENALWTALQELRDSYEDSLVDQLEPILQANLGHGRVKFYLEHNPGATPAGYVQQMAGLYLRLHPLLHELQVEKSQSAWETLRAKMETWAFSFLKRKGFDHSEASRQLARDYSADAAASLVNARFPYDTEFDPWAVVLVNRVCQKRLRDIGRNPFDAREGLDPETCRLDEQPDPDSHTRFHQADLHQDLQHALQRLPQDERQILFLYYYHDLSPAEIAAQLALKPAQVYTLKFKALRNLKKVLSQDGYES